QTGAVVACGVFLFPPPRRTIPPSVPRSVAGPTRLPVRPFPAIIVCALLAIGAAAHADDVARLRGGGTAHTDCMLVLDVVAAARAAHGRVLRCTDGDPTCDADA